MQSHFYLPEGHHAHFEIVKCDRYSGDDEVGAKVVAKLFIPKGEVLKDLCRTIKTVTAFFIIPGMKNFSIVNSSMMKV